MQESIIFDESASNAKSPQFEHRSPVRFGITICSPASTTSNTRSFVKLAACDPHTEQVASAISFRGGACLPARLFEISIFASSTISGVMVGMSAIGGVSSFFVFMFVSVFIECCDNPHKTAGSVF